MGKKTGYTLICSNPNCNNIVYIKKSVYEKSKTKFFYCSKPCKNAKESIKLMADFMEKEYGYRNVFQRKDVKEKIKSTMMERYGVENAFQHPKFIQKSINTLQAKYGVNNAQQNSEIKKKTLKTVKEKYGELVGAVPKKQYMETCLKRYGNEYFFGSNAGKMTKKNLINNYGWTIQKYNEYLRKKTTSMINGQTSSISEINFFTLLSKKINDKCIFGINNQFSIIQESSLFIYDFKLNNVLIDFHGDYWHGNPKIYNAGKMLRRKTIEEVWNRDRIRKEVAENNGFSYLVVWELDVKNNIDKEIKKCLKFIKENT